MDFELSSDEEALAAGVRRLCEGRFPIERVRELESAGSVDRGLWRELARAGVFSLRLPEDAGGAALGTAHAVLVFEELGRALVPGPLAFSHLAAGLVEGCAEGEVVVGGLERPAASNGSAPVVIEHLASLDTLVLVDDEGLWRVEPAELDARPLSEPLDPLTPLHVAKSVPRGVLLGGPDLARRWRLEGATLQSAALLGIAEATTEMAVRYAKEREQFGRPIGSFQAVKHMLADMFVREEVARSAAYAAGVTLDDPSVSNLERAVSVAKIEAASAAIANAKACVQAYGGMGFTWEVEVHLYLKRAHVLGLSFGSVDEHSERMAALLPA